MATKSIGIEVVNKVRVPTPLGHLIVEKALDKAGAKLGDRGNVNFTSIGHALKLNPSSIWFNLKGKRAWTVDRWLSTLYVLNAVRYDGKNLIISAPKLESINKLFNRFKVLGDE